MLIALIMIVGFFVTLMFIMWLTTVLVFGRADVPVEYVEEIAGRGEHAKGYERDLEEPGEEELEELVEPQLEAALEAVTDVMSSQSAALDALETDSNITGKGKGKGDSRQAGPGGEGQNIIPRWERWQIRYVTSSLDVYAKQLDFFKIEVGAAGGGRAKVDYARDFSRGIKVRQGDGDAEKRLYFSWKQGKLKEYDRKLLQKARIPVARRVVLQFYPKNLENTLAGMERKNAPGKKVIEFKRTVFAVRPAGSGYEFHIVSQTFRKPPS